MKRQLDIHCKDEGFALVTEHAEDGERITREQEQRESDRAESEKKQTELF